MKMKYAALSLSLFPLVLSASARADDCESEIAAARTDPRVVRVIETPATATRYSADFSPESEIRLSPGEMVYFVLPKEMRKSPIDFVTLGHRQDPSETSGGSASDYLVRDPYPAYLSVQFLRADTPAPDWRYWGGPASSRFGAKFAEVRAGGPEIEGLYEWRKYGTGSTNGRGDRNDLDHSALFSCLGRVVASGSDKLRFSRLVVKTSPEAPKNFETQIYTPGTAMGDFETAEGREYGGGEWHDGLYPDALTLKKANYTTEKPLRNGWSLLNENLRIPLKKGQRLLSVEVAAGDAKGMEAYHRYRRGGGSLGIALVHADGTRAVLLERENVGPEGVIKAAVDGSAPAKTGDFVEVQAKSGTVFVMGVRIGTN